MAEYLRISVVKKKTQSKSDLFVVSLQMLPSQLMAWLQLYCNFSWLHISSFSFVSSSPLRHTIKLMQGTWYPSVHRASIVIV